MCIYIYIVYIYIYICEKHVLYKTLFSNKETLTSTVSELKKDTYMGNTNPEATRKSGALPHGGVKSFLCKKSCITICKNV